MEVEKLEEFYSWQSKFYDFTRRFFLFSRKKSIELLDLKKSDKVIDLACGTGLNVPFLLKRVEYKNILGIDYSKSMLKVAKERYPRLKFVRGDVSRYNFRQKADKIISTYSISMIDNWKEAILNAKRTLNKGGILLILDFYQWKGRAKFFYPPFRWWLGKNGVNPEKEIIKFLKNHFERVDVRVLNFGYNFIVIAKK